MSWMAELYKTYENCKSEIGKNFDENKPPLLPIAHSTQNAQIEVVIDGYGNYVRSRKIEEKNDAVTIIPCTEDSAARSSGITPHPLCDKLLYVAGDYTEYSDKNKAEEYYVAYIEQLADWCKSEFKHRKVLAVYQYLSKKTLICDLIEDQILVCDEAKHISDKIKINNIAQTEAFVRFCVEIPMDVPPQIWLDHTAWDSYIRYYLSKHKNMQLCYVNGTIIPYSSKHPSKIRNAADKAKLISANDTSGFTYRGRFHDKDQVVSVGYETSQKAHNALKWLIDKQGYVNQEQVIVAWNTDNDDIPNTMDDSQETFYDEEEYIDTMEAYAHKLNQAIAGYGCKIDKKQINIISLNSATPGRLSVNYYREIDGREFLSRIRNWHITCLWRHTYKYIKDGTDNKGKEKYKNVTFIGAPSPKDMAFAAYGRKANKELIQATVERILPCIVDGAVLPYDLVKSAVNRTSNPVGFESKAEWEKNLTITCALIKKFRLNRKKYEEEWNMALDENIKDRGYLFGRMLAVAQQIESWALSEAGEKRETNAERYMHQFSLNPYRTWGIIFNNLRPYIDRLGNRADKYVNLLNSITAQIPIEVFMNSTKLEDTYILGYACQRQVFLDELQKNKEEKEQKLLNKNNTDKEERGN